MNHRPGSGGMEYRGKKGNNERKGFEGRNHAASVNTSSIRQSPPRHPIAVGKVELATRQRKKRERSVDLRLRQRPPRNPSRELRDPREPIVTHKRVSQQQSGERGDERRKIQVCSISTFRSSRIKQVEKILPQRTLPPPYPHQQT